MITLPCLYIIRMKCSLTSDLHMACLIFLHIQLIQLMWTSKHYYYEQSTAQHVKQSMNTFRFSFCEIAACLKRRKFIWGTSLKEMYAFWIYFILFVIHLSSNYIFIDSLLLFYFAGWMLVLSLALLFLHMHLGICLSHIVIFFKYVNMTDFQTFTREAT